MERIEDLENAVMVAFNEAIDEQGRNGHRIIERIYELEYLCEQVYAGRPELIIIRGIPGSGKSTFAKNQWPTYKDFESDFYFTDSVTKEYRFNPKMLRRNHKRCLMATERCLLSGRGCVVSNTFTRISEMQPYIDFCNENNIPFSVFRMENRFENRHGVPVDKVKIMADRFEDYPGEKIIQGNPEDRRMEFD